MLPQITISQWQNKKDRIHAYICFRWNVHKITEIFDRLVYSSLNNTDDIIQYSSNPRLPVYWLACRNPRALINPPLPGERMFLIPGGCVIACERRWYEESNPIKYSLPVVVSAGTKCRGRPSEVWKWKYRVSYAIYSFLLQCAVCVIHKRPTIPCPCGLAMGYPLYCGDNYNDIEFRDEFDIEVIFSYFFIFYSLSANQPSRMLKPWSQGKSEGFDKCDRPSNLTQIGFKSSKFQPMWPWNLMDFP